MASCGVGGGCSAGVRKSRLRPTAMASAIPSAAIVSSLALRSRVTLRLGLSALWSLRLQRGVPIAPRTAMPSDLRVDLPVVPDAGAADVFRGRQKLVLPML